MPIDINKPERQVSGFLIPDRSGKFIEIASGKPFEAGLVVYVGKAITAETVYERAMRFGRDVDREHLEHLIRSMAAFKIGDVVAMTMQPEFSLVKLKIARSSSSKLPK